MRNNYSQRMFLPIDNSSRADTAVAAQDTLADIEDIECIRRCVESINNMQRPTIKSADQIGHGASMNHWRGCRVEYLHTSKDNYATIKLMSLLHWMYDHKLASYGLRSSDDFLYPCNGVLHPGLQAEGQDCCFSTSAISIYIDNANIHALEVFINDCCDYFSKKVGYLNQKIYKSMGRIQLNVIVSRIPNTQQSNANGYFDYLVRKIAVSRFSGASHDFAVPSMINTKNLNFMETTLSRIFDGNNSFSESQHNDYEKVLRLVKNFRRNVCVDRAGSFNELNLNAQQSFCCVPCF